MLLPLCFPLLSRSPPPSRTASLVTPLSPHPSPAHLSPTNYTLPTPRPSCFRVWRLHRSTYLPHRHWFESVRLGCRWAAAFTRARARTPLRALPRRPTADAGEGNRPPQQARGARPHRISLAFPLALCLSFYLSISISISFSISVPSKREAHINREIRSRRPHDPAGCPPQAKKGK